MLIAIDFEILRNIKASGLISHELPRKPVRVATMLDEAEFIASGHKMIHNRTIFLEDQTHDWNWMDGKFRYYTRIAEEADALVVYQLKDIKYCTMCGKEHQEKSHTHCSHCEKK